MSISWDEYQLPALTAWLAEKTPLTHGEVLIATKDIEDNCFSGEISLRNKTFTVFASIETALSEISVNVAMGYIIALAYDKVEWKETPSHQILFDAHRIVCQSFLEFNEDFSQALEEHSDVIEAWYKAHINDQDPTTELTDTEDLVDVMSTSLFSANPDNTSKDYGSN